MRPTSRQWQALVGACLLQCAMLGVLMNCTGVLFAQIRQETGIRMTEISAYNTMRSVTGALLSATISGMFFKRNQKIALLLNQVMMCLSYMLMTIEPGGTVWYAAAAVAGISGCLGVVAVPSILSRVFPESSGTPTGIAMAFSGIGGAVFNPLCARLITLYGWRRTVLILCIIDLALSAAGVMLLFAGTDAQTASPFGQQPSESKAASGRIKWRRCILVTMVLVGSGIGFQLATNLSIFAQSIGYSLEVGATLTTMLMLGNVAGKFLYGALCDKQGVWRTTALGLVCVTVGTLAFLFLNQTLVLLYLAALLFGNIYALSTISISRCCMVAYGKEQYTRYIGLHNGINQGFTAVNSIVTGMVVDRWGSFSPVLIAVLVGAGMSMAGVLSLERMSAGDHEGASSASKRGMLQI